MIPFKINQTVKTNDGHVGRILFYTDYHESEPTSVVVIFVTKWACKYPFSALTPISLNEYDEAVKADKKVVEAIFQNVAVTECPI